MRVAKLIKEEWPVENFGYIRLKYWRIKPKN